MQRLAALSILEDDARALVADALKQLLHLGDIAKVRSRGQLRLARVRPTWFRLSERTGVLVGTIPSSTIGYELQSAESASRRFSLGDSELRAVLQEQGVVASTLEAWVGTPGFRRSLLRLGLEGEHELRCLWPRIIERVEREGLPLASPESAVIVTGRPGEFFGRPTAVSTSSGRWTAASQPGAWLGRRRGFDERDLRPMAVLIDSNEQARMCDLFDDDEFCWCLLSRGVVQDQREQVIVTRSDSPTVQVTCPLPRQLQRLLLLYGHRLDGWAWQVTDEVADALVDLVERFGLMVVESGGEV